MVDEAAPARIPDEDVAALRARLGTTRAVADPWAAVPGRGFGPAALAPLLERWATAYDWRAHEQRIRALPWRMAGGMRVVDARAADPAAPVVVLLHGWPDSVLRFERVLPLLGDLHVVVPALPGFPFAAPGPMRTSVNDAARLVIAAIADLGLERVVLSGGDIGGTVAEVVAGERPDLVAAMHLTDVSARHAFAADPEAQSAEGRDYLATAVPAWSRSEGGYIALQSTRPSTLVAGLGDSPAGLAAWLLEKVVAWSDDPAASFTEDDLLTWVSAYWFTGAIGTSFATYVEPARVPARTEVPTVLSAFPADLKPAPESYAAAFVDLREFVRHDAGGHFAAWEQPQAYAEDVRRAVRIAARIAS